MGEEVYFESGRCIFGVFPLDIYSGSVLGLTSWAGHGSVGVGDRYMLVCMNELTEGSMVGVSGVLGSGLEMCWPGGVLGRADVVREQGYISPEVF